jgi:asparagine synthase (glutamine-hydrolysing)
VSGICGVCEPGGSVPSSSLDLMLSALTFSQEFGRGSVRRNEAAFGVARHWDSQQLTASGGVLVAADAELLNATLLAGELLEWGFRGPLDTVAEIVAALYDRYGNGFVEKLEGAFSVALWDERARRLVLAIDRLGVNALYWRAEGARLFFASRVGAIRAVQDEEAEVDTTAVMQYLLFSAVPAPLSIYRRTYRLEPGTLLILENGGIRRKQYWNIDYVEDAAGGLKEWAEKVREGIRAAVHRSTIGCRPEAVGAYLSGGTDSSSVVAFLTEWHAPAKSFSIFFDEDQYSEVGFARTTAQRFETQHHEQCLRPQNAYEALANLNRYYDEPFANSSAIGCYYCARLASLNGVSTLLAGDGGDELFGGNERYVTDKRFSLYGMIPEVIRKRLIEPAAERLPTSDGLLALPRKYVRRAHIPNPRRIYSYGIFLTQTPEMVFEPEFLRQVPPETWMNIAQGHFDTGANRSELNRILYMDAKMTLADNDLRKVVGTAELAGVRARFPLLDHRLVELAAHIPVKWKIRGFEKRYIFKQAMKDVLPAKVLYKKKHGFGVPVSLWLREDPRLEALMKDVVTDSKTRQRGYFLPGFLDQLITRHRFEDAKNYGEILWYVLILELWHREHFERKPEYALC